LTISDNKPRSGASEPVSKLSLLFEKIDEVMLDGLSSDNIELAIQLVESLKLEEKCVRERRQSLETLIYNNIHLVIEKVENK
jgi:hypothetical protein